VTLLCLVLVAGCAQLREVLTPTHSPPAPARPQRPEPPPARLSPQVSSERETQLIHEVNTLMRGVERTLLAIDHRKLKVNQAETYHTIQSFLTQAREALTIKDFQQAINLAQKARILSDELSNTIR